MNSNYVQEMRSKASRCRELAKTASDPEVADELLRLAAELETALHLLEDEGSTEGRNTVPGPKGRLDPESLPNRAVQAS